MIRIPPSEGRLNLVKELWMRCIGIPILAGQHRAQRKYIGEEATKKLSCGQAIMHSTSRWRGWVPRPLAASSGLNQAQSAF